MRVLLAVATSAGCSLAPAAPVSEVLNRPALMVQAPGRCVLLGAVLAGARWVAVGERGVVALSDDTGAHWAQARSVPVSSTLTAVRFIDTQHGWAVGHGGVVLSTGDGGQNWTRQLDGMAVGAAVLRAARETRAADGTDPAHLAKRLVEAERLVSDGPDKPFLDLYFSNDSEGFVVGAYNLMFHTIDAGRSWQFIGDRLDNPKGSHLYAITGVGSRLFVAGEQGLLARSDDGGRSFARLPSPYQGSWFALALLDADTLVVAGLRGNAYLSSDRGATWRRLEGAPSTSFVSASKLPDGTVLLANQAGQLFIARRDTTTLTALVTAPLPPTNAVLPIREGQLLALTVQGTVTLPVSKAAR